MGGDESHSCEAILLIRSQPGGSKLFFNPRLGGAEDVHLLAEGEVEREVESSVDNSRSDWSIDMSSVAAAALCACRSRVCNEMKPNERPGPRDFGSAPLRNGTSTTCSLQGRMQEIRSIASAVESENTRPRGEDEGL